MGQRGATSPVMITALSLALLAGCGGDGENPFQEETDPEAPEIDDGEVQTDGIPAELAGNLRSVAYDPDAGTLSVDMAALDRDDEDIPLESYTRNTNLETSEMQANGYRAFSFQDDALDRMFVALVAESEDGSVQGAAVMDGGQFTRFFGGSFFATDGSYTPGGPTTDTGLVSYAGLYTGLSNIDGYGNELLPVSPGTPDQLRPAQPGQTQGDVFFNVDFDDNTINGAIYNRAWTNLNPALAGSPDLDLDDVFLLPADITTAGSFFGDARAIDDDGNEIAIGSYGGTFGGTDAAGLAGTTHLTDYLGELDAEEEFGVFVLTQCGQPGEAAFCDSIPVNP